MFITFFTTANSERREPSLQSPTVLQYYNTTSCTHVCRQAFRSRITFSFHACYMYCQSPPPVNSNILPYSSHKTFPTPSTQLRCSQTPSVCIFPLLWKTRFHTHTKQKRTMPYNTNIQLTLPLHLSYVQQSQSLPKPSSATTAPFVPFSSATSLISKSKPRRNSTIKITHFTLRCWLHTTSQLTDSIRIAKTRPITQRTKTNASGGSELQQCHNYSLQACVQWNANWRRNSSGEYALWKAYPAAYELIPFFSHCVWQRSWK